MDNSHLTVDKLAIDNTECCVDDADTPVGVVEGVFTHAVRKTVLCHSKHGNVLLLDTQTPDQNQDQFNLEIKMVASRTTTTVSLCQNPERDCSMILGVCQSVCANMGEQINLLLWVETLADLRNIVFPNSPTDSMRPLPNYFGHLFNVNTSYQCALHWL